MIKKSYLRRIYDKLYRFYGPQGWWPAETRLEVIVGAILTQNTAWTNVEKAIGNLKRADLLSGSDKLEKISGRKLAGLIRPAGYYNIKAKRLKNFINFLMSCHGGSLKRLARRQTGILRYELLNINGIGPETCDSILLYAFKRPVFVVDAYTKRIFSRHRLMEEDISYEYAQRIFMDALPGDERLFNEYHALIVRAAKEFCRSKARCNGCPLEDFVIL